MPDREIKVLAVLRINGVVLTAGPYRRYVMTLEDSGIPADCLVLCASSMESRGVTVEGSELDPRPSSSRG